ncbi:MULTISPECIES: hypothetical protein [unclassified Rhizobium]|uniref:hypothetical protein n=1 Tax=Rhizobium TaxID=379 RepID=UPI00114D371F|nr:MULTISPECIES: hypothetical protein [unclassified Rhizobium]QYA14939.1 hypothetical protein J5284_24160 [Rhizobium sp. AB2/73]UEQ83072.1 hypothetical protein I8E17_22990 [Rhizobium sp. AB2/73]
MPISKDDVSYGYRYLLGRLPENNDRTAGQFLLLAWALLVFSFSTGAWAQSASTVQTNAALQSTSISGLAVGTTIVRSGFYAAGDGGAATYTLSASNCTGPDNGAKVQPSSGTGCWMLQPSTITDIRIWGAQNNNSTDIGQYVQKAYDANVGCIFIPAGIWLWSSAVTMSAQTPCFRGAGWNEAVSAGSLSSTNMLGTWIHRSSTSFTPATISGLAGQGGTPSFSYIAFYDDQPTIGTGPWTPNAYPYFFVLNNNGRVDFDNIMFYNTTHCISVFNSARGHITNIYGQPQGTCLSFDHMHDISTLKDIQFWPFWSGASVVAAFDQTVDPIVYARSDSPFIDDIFTLSYHSALAFTQSNEGTTTGAQIGSVSADATLYGIWIKPDATGVQLQIANLRGSGQAFPGTGSQPGSGTYRDSGTSTQVSIGNIDCFYAGGSCISVLGSGSLQFGNGVLWNYNNDNNGSAAIDAGASGFISGANPPSIANVTHPAPVIPTTSAGGIYELRGVRQYWTPGVVGSGESGTVTYSSRVGTFWYDGSQVTITFYINGTTSSGLSGSLFINGLPFTDNELPDQHAFCTISSMAGITLSPSFTILSGVVVSGLNQILLVQSGSGQATIPAPTTIVTGGSGSFVLGGSCTFASGQ